MKPALRHIMYDLYAWNLERKLKSSRLPEHIGVVCDGNRRWAQAAGFDDITHGHRMGALKILEMIRWCDSLRIAHITVFLLSTENLQREVGELETLFAIIKDIVAELCHPKNTWKVSLVGSTDGLPKSLMRELESYVALTSRKDGVTVYVAIGYGGRQEIIDAVRGIITEQYHKNSSLNDLISSVTVHNVQRHLYAQGAPDPDLIIRTSGEQRLSGFLLWQSAYSEIWFTDVLWPEFRKVDFLRALRNFSGRQRRYGK